VSNISEEGILLQGNNLWVPTARRRAAEVENLARAMGVDLRRLELRRAVRRSQQRRLPRPLSRQRLRVADRADSYWYDFRRSRRHERVISDAANWPAMGTRSLAGYQQKRSGSATAAGRSSTSRQMVGATDRYDGRSVAVADLPNRGALDVDRRQPARTAAVVPNEVAPIAQWIAFELEGSCRADQRTTRARIAAPSARR
jgi:hypothetical protein